MARMTALTEVAEGVFRLGDRLVNWWLVVDGSDATLVDAGLPGHHRQLLATLRRLGLRRSSIVGVVATHGHVDHVACAAILQRRQGTPVHVPRGDVALATSRPSLDPAVARHAWHPAAVRTGVSFLLNGVALARPLDDPTPIDGEQSFDLPGRPRFVPAPGHTAGSGIVVLDERDAVCSGDVLVTLDPFSGRTGPQTLPAFDNLDHDAAVAALDVLGGCEAGIVLPGHGEPYHGSPSVAAELARVASLAA